VVKRDERKSARGARYAFVALSDPTGMYEVAVFGEVLAASREMLEPGCNVVLTVEAEPGGDGLKLTCRAVQPVEAVAAEAGAMGLRVHLDSEAALASLHARLSDAGTSRRGAAVEIVIADPALDAEIELALPGDWAITPALRGAVKAADGVLMVEDF